MATSMTQIATAVVMPAISISLRTRAISAACSGLGSGYNVSVMQGSSSKPGKRSVTVSGDEGAVRLDRVLAAQLPELSRSRLKALILDGHVMVGTAAVRDPAYHVRPGETIIIDLPEPVEAEPGGEAIALDIVY